MTREQIESLKELASSLPDKLIPNKYYDTEAECHCVIGYALNAKFGISNSQLSCTGVYVDSFNSYMRKFTKKLTDEYGLTAEELRYLQDINDLAYDNSPEKRAIAVKAYLLQIIKEKEAEIND